MFWCFFHISQHQDLREQLPNRKEPKPAKQGILFGIDTSLVTRCKCSLASMLIPSDANSALRSFSAFTPSTLAQQKDSWNRETKLDPSKFFEHPWSHVKSLGFQAGASRSFGSQVGGTPGATGVFFAWRRCEQQKHHRFFEKTLGCHTLLSHYISTIHFILYAFKVTQSFPWPTVPFLAQAGAHTAAPRSKHDISNPTRHRSSQCLQASKHVWSDPFEPEP